ncbi:GNAT family N-acetyltransferase [Sphingomonas sp. MMS24-J13]|uniref:GNAT family N-acetyltransferase n=1 Tax=Sphingomonas sp. MMS24-J13 TaxID=3238686 RepID=UPI003850D5B7
MNIRPATLADAQAITDIYAHHVLHGTGTFEEEPPSGAEITRRIEAIVSRGWPWLVAETDDGVIGYAYAAMFRDRAAYRYSAEDSIYVRHDAVGGGIGRALLQALMAASAASGFRRMFAVIGDSGNKGSIRLHERAGFTMVGTLDDAGHKFGRDLDVVLMQRALP